MHGTFPIATESGKSVDTHTSIAITNAYGLNSLDTEAAIKDMQAHAQLSDDQVLIVSSMDLEKQIKSKSMY